MPRSHPIGLAVFLLLVLGIGAYFATAPHKRSEAPKLIRKNDVPADGSIQANPILQKNSAQEAEAPVKKNVEVNAAGKAAEPRTASVILGFDDGLKNWLQPTARWNYVCACEELPEKGNVATISDLPDAKEFGNLMQRLDARPYQGKWVRFSGNMKRNVTEGWAGFWMRLDGPKQEVLGFENMQNLRLTGAHGFEYHSVELFVPMQTISLNLGAILVGKGKIWIADLKLETFDHPASPAPQMSEKEMQDF